MYGKLYVVGTPIGNLNDFSPRAAETLKTVDFIAAEDTRVSVKILNSFDISTPMVSYHEHNMHEKGKTICDRIMAGENCAIVTDAGMPCISDPGEELIRMCAELGIDVLAVPGPSALTAALAVSGLSTGRFCFEGFLSVNKHARAEHLEELTNEKRTMIFYEAPHKLISTLNDLYKYFGDRRISIVREITKIHEQVIRTTLREACENFTQGDIKGEIVLVLEGKSRDDSGTVYDLSGACQIAWDLVSKGLSNTEASRQAAKITGVKKGDIYKEILEKE